MTLLKALEALSQFAGSSPNQKGSGPTQPSGEESLLRNDWVSLYLSPVAIRCDFGAFFRLFPGRSPSFAASLGRKTPSRRTDTGQGWKCPWTPPKSKTSGLTR